MDVTPISGVEELEQHLGVLFEAPDTPLNVKLFDDVELQLTEQNTPPLVPRLLPKLTEILSKYTNDPAQLVSLSIKLLGPVPFTEVMHLATEESLVRALSSPAPSANILAITVLQKAAKAPSDTAILSNMQKVVLQFIQTWLSSPDVGVGEKATKALGDLLMVDCDHRASMGLDAQMDRLELTSNNPPGQGLLWRRLFHDEEIYRTIFSLCSRKTQGTGPGQLDERQKSLAQARVLRILPRIAALDFSAVTQSHFPDVEAEYSLPADQQGLLYFAAMVMVDKDDILMHMTLIDFFAEFLEFMSMIPLSKATMDRLALLMKKVTASDSSLYKSLESLALSPNSPPELVELLVKIEEYP